MSTCIPCLLVKLFDPVEQRQIEVSLTDKRGHYKFQAGRGEYLIMAYTQGYILEKDDAMEKINGQHFLKMKIKNGITKNIIRMKKV
jgi:hypothetical protein